MFSTINTIRRYVTAQTKAAGEQERYFKLGRIVSLGFMAGGAGLIAFSVLRDTWKQKRREIEEEDGKAMSTPRADAAGRWDPNDPANDPANYPPLTTPELAQRIRELYGDLEERALDDDEEAVSALQDLESLIGPLQNVETFDGEGGFGLGNDGPVPPDVAGYQEPTNDREIAKRIVHRDYPGQEVAPSAAHDCNQDHPQCDVYHPPSGALDRDPTDREETLIEEGIDRALSHPGSERLRGSLIRMGWTPPAKPPEPVEVSWSLDPREDPSEAGCLRILVKAKDGKTYTVKLRAGIQKTLDLTQPGAAAPAFSFAMNVEAEIGAPVGEIQKAAGPHDADEEPRDEVTYPQRDIGIHPGDTIRFPKAGGGCVRAIVKEAGVSPTSGFEYVELEAPHLPGAPSGWSANDPRGVLWRMQQSGAALEPKPKETDPAASEAFFATKLLRDQLARKGFSVDDATIVGWTLETRTAVHLWAFHSNASDPVPAILVPFKVGRDADASAAEIQKAKNPPERFEPVDGKSATAVLRAELLRRGFDVGETVIDNWDSETWMRVRSWAFYSDAHEPAPAVLADFAIGSADHNPNTSTSPAAILWRGLRLLGFEVPMGAINAWTAEQTQEATRWATEQGTDLPAFLKPYRIKSSDAALAEEGERLMFPAFAKLHDKLLAFGINKPIGDLADMSVEALAEVAKWTADPFEIPYSLRAYVEDEDKLRRESARVLAEGYFARCYGQKPERTPSDVSAGPSEGIHYLCGMLRSQGYDVPPDVFVAWLHDENNNTPPPAFLERYRANANRESDLVMLLPRLLRAGCVDVSPETVGTWTAQQQHEAATWIREGQPVGDPPAFLKPFGVSSCYAGTMFRLRDLGFDVPVTTMEQWGLERLNKASVWSTNAIKLGPQLSAPDFLEHYRRKPEPAATQKPIDGPASPCGMMPSDTPETRHVILRGLLAGQGYEVPMDVVAHWTEDRFETVSGWLAVSEGEADRHASAPGFLAPYRVRPETTAKQKDPAS